MWKTAVMHLIKELQLVIAMGTVLVGHHERR